MSVVGQETHLWVSTTNHVGTKVDGLLSVESSLRLIVLNNVGIPSFQ